MRRFSLFANHFLSAATTIDLPIALLPSVACIALPMTFGRCGLIEQYASALDVELAFTTTAVVLAQTFEAAPFCQNCNHRVYRCGVRVGTGSEA